MATDGARAVAHISDAFPPVPSAAGIDGTAARLRLAMQAGRLGSWEFDLATGTGQFSAAAAAMHGLPATPCVVTTQQWHALIHPAHRDAAKREFSDALTRLADYTLEYRAANAGGETRWLSLQGAFLRDAQGRPTHVVGVVQDVTARRQVQAAVREKEERFRRVFEQSPLGKATAGPDFQLRAVNPALCRMLGYDARQLAGRNFLDLVHPDDRANCLDMATSLVEGRIPQIQVEARFQRQSGEPLWVSVNIGPIRDADGRVIDNLGIIENIDERRRITQALQHSEQRLRELNEKLEQQAEERARQLASSRAQLQAFFDNSPDWLTLQRATPDGQFTYVDINPACEAGYGLARDQVIGRRVADILGREAAEVPIAHFRECLRTNAPQRYVTQRTMAGITRSLDVMVAAVPSPAVAQAAPEDRFVLTWARDVTERERLEGQLRHAQKMEAIAQLTGGVAHDFNNLLTVIIGNAGLAKRRRGTDLSPMVDNIMLAGERGVALTRRLLSLSRHQPQMRQVVDLHTEMPRIVEMLRSSLRGDIELLMSLAEDAGAVEVDLGELEMALLNVAVNARDAMPKGGSLAVEIGRFDAGLVRRPADGAAPEGLTRNYVAIALRDTGGGMPREVIARAFEPFFTTKELGSGTGLGLSQVYSFATSSGGTATITSEPGAGTCVTLYLPATSLPATGKPPAHARRDDAGQPPPPDVARRPDRILLVEDNPDVANVTEMMLRAMGFDVETTDRARKALDLLAATPCRFDLLMTDVVMPDGMTGLDLARGARTRLPSLPIILVSGYNNTVPVGEAEFRLLRKPVPFGELQEAIRSSLKAAAATLL